MPQKPGEFSISKQAGKFQKNKPILATCERINTDDEGLGPEVELWWSSGGGVLYLDRECTVPAGGPRGNLAIVRLR